MIIAINITI